MSTKSRRDKKNELRKERRRIRCSDDPRQTFFAMESCGCCTARMAFVNESSAKAAFNDAGLRYDAIIVDDDGKEHVVDTFYGFWEEETQDSLLNTLMHKIGF